MVSGVAPEGAILVKLLKKQAARPALLLSITQNAD